MKKDERHPRQVTKKGAEPMKTYLRPPGRRHKVVATAATRKRATGGMKVKARAKAQEKAKASAKPAKPAKPAGHRCYSGDQREGGRKEEREAVARVAQDCDDEAD